MPHWSVAKLHNLCSADDNDPTIYPGAGEMGAAVVERCGRTMIFGGKPTVDAYRGDPRVQVHGPGFSKVLLVSDGMVGWSNNGFKTE